MEKIITTSEINLGISKSAQEFILKSEKAVTGQIESIANKIISDGSENKPLILISGPSGSGKTTVASMLSDMVRSKGYNICYISMDNYFKSFNDVEKRLKSENKIDLESPERLDAEFLNSELKSLIDGESIHVAEYDFSTNTRIMTDRLINRNGGFVIVEGIHALNPAVLGQKDSFSERIYASVRTRVVDSEGDKLHPSKIRLLRRMLRDKLFRDRTIEETIMMYHSVEMGEQNYILPYKCRAHFQIDTFLAYEPAIYRAFLPKLRQLSGKLPEVIDIVRALDELLPLGTEYIPSGALMREFVGG